MKTKKYYSVVCTSPYGKQTYHYLRLSEFNLIREIVKDNFITEIQISEARPDIYEKMFNY